MKISSLALAKNYNLSEISLFSIVPFFVGLSDFSQNRNILLGEKWTNTQLPITKDGV